MFREVLENLVEWKDKKNRKILLLAGQKGVGKTYTLRDFGEGCFDNCAFIDVKKDEYIKTFFKKGLDKKKLCSILEISNGNNLNPSNSLIVIDNIDAAGQVSENLQFLVQNMSEYHIAVTFCGVEDNILAKEKIPSDTLDIIRMYPLNFREFLYILKRDDLCRKIKDNGKNPISDYDKKELEDYIRKYIFVGGMPSVVQKYLDTANMQVVENEKQRVLDEFLAGIKDITNETIRNKVHQIWKSVPRQLEKENKKFQFGAVKITARAREYSDAGKWLIDNKYVSVVFRIKNPVTPLKKYIDLKSYEVFVTDVGLLSSMCGLSWDNIKSDDIQTLAGGAIIEELVYQELSANPNIGELCYWISEATAKISFLFEDSGQVIPIEINLKENAKAQSIKVFRSRYNPGMYISITEKTVSMENGVLKLPIFAIWNL